MDTLRPRELGPDDTQPIRRHTREERERLDAEREVLAKLGTTVEHLENIAQPSIEYVQMHDGRLLRRILPEEDFDIVLQQLRAENMPRAVVDLFEVDAEIQRRLRALDAMTIEELETLQATEYARFVELTNLRDAWPDILAAFEPYDLHRKPPH